jgi:hypothetical protein
MMIAMTLPVEPEVNSREELALYVDKLCVEFQQRGNTWENATLERFLEALAACIRDHSRETIHQPEAPAGTPAQWGYLAFVLGAATVYE